MPKLIFDHADVAEPYTVEFPDGGHIDAVAASLESQGWVARPVDADGEPAEKPTPKSQLKSAASSADTSKEN